jgi:hypothetical protein
MMWRNRDTLAELLATRTFGRAPGRILTRQLNHYLTRCVVHSASELFSLRCVRKI